VGHQRTCQLRIDLSFTALPPHARIAADALALAGPTEVMTEPAFGAGRGPTAHRHIDGEGQVGGLEALP
jgi:hypothetical protein